MQIHGKGDINRAACPPYLWSSCTWHGKIMWNCRGVIAGLERCEGQSFCSKELTVTMKTHRVGILSVWMALISTCHIHASNFSLAFCIMFCILLEERIVKCWTGFLCLKKHRQHEHWAKCDFWVSKKPVFNIFWSRYLGPCQEGGRKRVTVSTARLVPCFHVATPAVVTCHNVTDSTACQLSFQKICTQVHLAEPKEDTGLQSFHAYKQ